MSLVVITDSDLAAQGVEEGILAGAGHEVRRLACRSAADVIAGAADADALIVQWAPISGDVIAALGSLRLVSRLGIGLDMIDVGAATAHGVAVANTPDYCIDEVTAHTLASILAATRGLLAYDRAVRAGSWRAAVPGVAVPRDQVVAVVGLGRIGQRVARALLAVGYRVIGVDPVAATPDGVAAAAHDDAIAQADIVTLHAPLTDATWHLLDAARIARMRPGAIVVNTCRGPLIDEAALAAALVAGQLGGAYLDVFEREPLRGESPLVEAPGVVLSPHAAWYSPAALAELPRRAAQQVVEFLAGRAPASIVNPAYAGRTGEGGG